MASVARPTTGFGFQAKKEQTKRTAALAAHVAKSWSGPGPAPSADVLAALRITVITAICALPETSRTRLIDTWDHCCRGTVFMDPYWRKMIICIFIVMQPAFFLPAAFKTVLILFSPELRLARKALHMVAPHREHSFGFIQVGEFIKECEIQHGMYTASNGAICGPFVKYGQLFVTLGLLKEVDGLISHDGWLIIAVNELYMSIGGTINCRLTPEVWVLVCYNMIIGIEALCVGIPKSIWASCFWGADSQGKQVFLTGLLDSYVAVYDLASPFLAYCPITAGQPLPVIPAFVRRQLRELVDSEQVTGILDAGYPDAEIVAALERNRQAIAAQCEADRAVFQLAGYPM